MIIMLIKLRRLLVLLAIMSTSVIKLTSSAPKTWPYMKTYDIWETNKTSDVEEQHRSKSLENSLNFVESHLQSGHATAVNRRKAKGELVSFSL